MRLLTSAAAAVAMAASLGIVHAQTATPAATPAPAIAQQRTQVPGYYRMALGDDVVTALYDGYVDLPAKTLVGMSA
ncbi:MAG: MBL fold metallo-hydrolase, partial [Ralstonia mannitolilytica]